MINKAIHTKKYLKWIKLRKLITVAALIGFLAALLGVTLKRITEYYETLFFEKASLQMLYFIVLPVLGLSIIHLLRHYIFQKKENKGIKEIFESTNSSDKNLPAYKIPSHFINGLLTVISGGSTGIEVSTVVASATIGSVAHQKKNIFRKHKTALICAGVAAGITALFSSPFAGLLFSLEVISRKVNKVYILTNITAVMIASVLIYLLKEAPLFVVTITTWNYYAIPYFILLGILAGINSVYLTHCVLFFKKKSLLIQNIYLKISLGAVLLSLSLIALPQLYGEGYHAIKEIILHSDKIILTVSLVTTLVGILILKPLVTSITLASGGDGGVFAPSIFIGAFLGLLVAGLLNTFFNANVIPINFMVIGMAAMLSASIHAPFTALFLVCGLINDYTLFFPILVVCLISKYTAKKIYPFSVYSYNTIVIK